MGSKPLVAARIAMHQARTSLLNAEQKLRNFRFADAALALRRPKENNWSTW
jgi:hypothetical protein